jgi:hypothetical protein
LHEAYRLEAEQCELAAARAPAREYTEDACQVAKEAQRKYGQTVTL